MTDIVKRLRSPVSQENDIFFGQRPGEEVKSYDMVRFDGSYEIERLRAALVDAAASLAAAISLLERGGKKAAASDKMFAVMLDDYSKSLDRARAALDGKQ